MQCNERPPLDHPSDTTFVSRPEQVGSPVTVAAASSLTELREAFRLVYAEYLKAGYILPNSARMHYSVLQLFPTSFTFIATHSGCIVGTGSVVITSDAGLPSSDVFPDVFLALAASGRLVAEGTMLACTAVEGVSASCISRRMIPEGLLWSLARGVDDWCVVSNPKHVRFWHETLGMEILAESRPCEHVRGHPGVLLRLPLREIRTGELQASPSLGLPERLPGLGDGAPAGYELSEEEVAALMARRPDILDGLPPIQWARLRRHHPMALWLVERKGLGSPSAIAA